MVTGNEVKDAMIAAGIKRVNHHDCAICGVWTCYERQGEHLFFDSNCGCSSYWHDPEYRPWGEAADFIERQSSVEVRNDLRERFGLPKEEN